MAVREWYEHKDQSEAWALKQAMLTIRNAKPMRETNSDEPSEQGRATWLRSLEGGKPLVARIACPLASVPTTLEGKDWTRYEGVLHTDHAVRAEFFLDRPLPPTASSPYLMDFTYLYDQEGGDFGDFTGGKRFPAETVFADIGRPEDWNRRGSRTAPPRSDEKSTLVAEQLDVCRRWESTYEFDE